MKFTDEIKIECIFPENGKYYLLCLAFPKDTKTLEVLRHLGIPEDKYVLSIWSKKCTLETIIENGDRLEVNFKLPNKHSCY